MKKLIIPFLFIASMFVTSCADHDDPELSPIDTTQVKIAATVHEYPTDSWLNPTEEMTISVSNVKMDAPKGVVLRSISLCNNGRPIMDKPYSGETLEFKIPMSGLIAGRLNFSIVGHLIQKNCRDAEILIADNIQRILFTQTPNMDCEGKVNIEVKSVSTSGEEYSHSFEVKSIDYFTIPVPQSELYWSPKDGTASTLELTLTGEGRAWSSNSTLDGTITNIYWGSRNPDGPVLKVTVPNTPGALNSEHLQLYVMAEYYGVNEGISVKPQKLLSVFSLVEK